MSVTIIKFRTFNSIVDHHREKLPDVEKMLIVLSIL